MSHTHFLLENLNDNHYISHSVAALLFEMSPVVRSLIEVTPT